MARLTIMSAAVLATSTAQDLFLPTPSALPSFEAHSLRSADLMSALREHGALEISGVPGLAAANLEALAALAACGAESGGEGMWRKSLPDGAQRWTLAAASPEADAVTHALLATCPDLEGALAPLRDAVGSAGDRFVHGLSRQPEVGALGPVARLDGGGGFEALVAEGRSLEHFHLYLPAAEPEGEEAVPLHVDMGAFLVLSRALTFQGSQLVDEPEGAGFLMQTPAGATLAPRVRDDSVLVLMGDAMRSFLGADVQVPPHAVNLRGFPAGSLRAWHGRMYLFADESRNDEGQMAKSLFMAPASRSGHGPWTASLKEECATGMAQCWMRDAICVPQCPDGQLQQCLLPDRTNPNSTAGPACGPQVMNGKCSWRCPNSSAVLNTNGFCNSNTNVDMYMNGFTSTKNSDRACVVLFFKGLKLDSAPKFAIGCVLVALMGVLTQAVISVRPWVQKRCDSKVVDSLMFGFNVALGWFMMLVAMTFSTELFISATCGLILGHYFFAEKGSTKILGSPCCNAVNDRPGSMPLAARPLLDGLESFKAELKIDGMTCDSCTRTVRGAVMSVDGVASCEVSLAEGRARVTYQQPATPQAIADAVDCVGFDAQLVGE